MSKKNKIIKKGGDNALTIKNNKYRSGKVTYIHDPKLLEKNKEFPEFYYEGEGSLKNLILKLEQNEGIYAEGGVMNYMKNDLILEVHARGGLLSSFSRSLGGTSFFLSKIYNTTPREGLVSLSPMIPSDIGCFYIPPGKSICLLANSYIASTLNVELGTHFRFGGFLTGYGLFYSKMSVPSDSNGPGLVWASSFGKVIEMKLRPQEKITIDNGILLGFDENTEISTTTVGGISSTLFSGEALVSEIENRENFDITVFLQGRSILFYNQYIKSLKK